MTSNGRSLRSLVTHKQTSQKILAQAILFLILMFLMFYLGDSTIALWQDPIRLLEAGFAGLTEFQQQMAGRFSVPTDCSAWKLILVLVALAQIPIRTPPQIRLSMQRLVAGILLVLLLRYFLWRSLTTLNFASFLEGAFGLTLYSLEVLGLLSLTIQLLLHFQERDRRKEADIYSGALLAGRYLPTVDVLIPTYNEPAVILQRTIVGCQAMIYPHKRIYLLDDGQRSDIRDLALSLGCEYLARPDNRHAKAGNLNYAIDRSQGELIVVFDADFIPTRNFLLQTLGFFQNPRIGLVQTPQTFYNPHPINNNLGLDETPHYEEVFYRHVHLLRDAIESSICVGSSFVVRRSALQAIGGFVTSSLTEDYFTGVRLTAEGYQLAYLNEKLSAGLAAENITAYLSQQCRWARGTLQALFIPENPLTIPGLKFQQRLAHLEGFLHWFNNVSRVFFLLAPIAASLLALNLLNTTVIAWSYYFLPFYLVHLTTYHWLNRQTQSVLISNIASVVVCFPIATTVIQTLIRPFGRGFKVTPKGTVSDRSIFRWQAALPLLGVWILTSGNLGYQIWLWGTGTVPLSNGLYSQTGLQLGLCWSLYNLVTIGLALLSFRDRPCTDLYPQFELQRTVILATGNHRIEGVTHRISEIGADLIFEAHPKAISILQKFDRFTFSLPEESLTLVARLSNLQCEGEQIRACVTFEDLSLPQQRSLIELLFCQPGQWKPQNAPTEWEMLKKRVQKFWKGMETHPEISQKPCKLMKTF